MTEGREPLPLSASLDGVVRSLRGPSRAAVGGLFGRWAESVGDQVAQHVKPVKLDGTTLLVEVDEPAWATQVKLVTPMIIERLASVAHVKIERIDVRVDRLGARGHRTPKR